MAGRNRLLQSRPMNAPFASHDKPNIQALLEAVASNPNDPTLSHLLTPAQWTVLGGYMQASVLAPDRKSVV